MLITPAQEAAMEKVRRLHRELLAAQEELTQLVDPELAEYESEQRRPKLRLVRGEALAASA